MAYITDWMLIKLPQDRNKRHTFPSHIGLSLDDIYAKKLSDCIWLLSLILVFLYLSLCAFHYLGYSVDIRVVEYALSFVIVRDFWSFLSNGCNVLGIAPQEIKTVETRRDLFALDEWRKCYFNRLCRYSRINFNHFRYTCWSISH